MRHRIVALLVSFAFVACSTHVHVHSNPPGARVWISGHEVGVTPVTAAVPYDSLTQIPVRLEKPGFETYVGYLRTDVDPLPLFCAIACLCLPALLWTIKPAPVQSFDLIPLGGAPVAPPPAPDGTPYPSQDPPQGAAGTLTISVGVPAAEAEAFLASIEAAAQGRGLRAWRTVDGVFIEPEPGSSMRYEAQVDGVVLVATFPDAAAESRVRDLHDALTAGRAKEPPPPAPSPTSTSRPARAPAGAAPTPTPARRGADLAREPRMTRCASGVDCGPGEFCKDRGDGMTLCMGNNVRGEFCVSGIDCAPGLFCKDRGDGLKMCMGKGTAGDPCASSVDCAGGLRCKDPGDGGFRVCR